MNNIVGPISVA